MLGCSLRFWAVLPGLAVSLSFFQVSVHQRSSWRSNGGGANADRSRGRESSDRRSCRVSRVFTACGRYLTHANSAAGITQRITARSEWHSLNYPDLLGDDSHGYDSCSCVCDDTHRLSWITLYPSPSHHYRRERYHSRRISRR